MSLFEKVRSAALMSVVGTCVMAVVAPGVGGADARVAEPARTQVRAESEPPGAPAGLAAKYNKDKKKLTVTWFPANGHGLPILKYKYFAKEYGTGKVYHQAEVAPAASGGAITHWASHTVMKKCLDIAVIAVSAAGDGEPAVTKACS